MRRLRYAAQLVAAVVLLGIGIPWQMLADWIDRNLATCYAVGQMPTATLLWHEHGFMGRRWPAHHDVPAFSKSA